MGKKFLMKLSLVLCAVCVFALGAFSVEASAGETHNVGLLTKLNSTQEEYKVYMDAALSSGLWTLFTVESQSTAFFVFYDSLIAMQMGLNSGEVDEIDLPGVVGKYMVNINPNYAVACVARMSKPVYLAFGFLEKDGTELRNKFNEALKAMKADNTLSLLHTEYLSEPGTKEAHPVTFEKFDGADTITIAVTGDLPPIDYIAPNGIPAGFNTAILAEIGKRLHVNIKLLNIDSAARASALASKRADVAFWFLVLKDEDKQPDVPAGVILSEPYYEWNEYLHIRKK